MAIHPSKTIKLLIMVTALFLGILLLEWLIINAILGCYSYHEILWSDHSQCFTLKQFVRG